MGLANERLTGVEHEMAIKEKHTTNVVAMLVWSSKYLSCCVFLDAAA